MSKHAEQIQDVAATPEQIQVAQDAMNAVNLDEITIEVIRIKVRSYKEEIARDDEGSPLLDDEGHELKNRVPSTRTARIQNFVPTPIYHQALALRKDLDGSDMQAQLGTMTDLVLAVWQQSEPWMTRQKLEEGVDFLVIGELFSRFFGQQSPLVKHKA